MKNVADNGVFVMKVTATDYDDPRTDNAQLEYSIVINKEINGQPVFRIVPNNGKIYAMVIYFRKTKVSFDQYLFALFLISFYCKFQKLNKQKDEIFLKFSEKWIGNYRPKDNLLSKFELLTKVHHHLKVIYKFL